MKTAQDWKVRHVLAWDDPSRLERPIVNGIKSWLEYAEISESEYGWNIADDGVLGEYWVDWGKSLSRLLDGPVGSRLDCGTLSRLIADTLKAHGVEVE